MFFLREKLLFGIILFGTVVAIKPPGYTEKPKEPDDNPPNYEYGYSVSGDNAGQGHKEQRDGEHTKGSYYVNLPEGSKSDVAYVADDWGYHPFVKYSTNNAHSQVSGHFALGHSAVQAYNANQASSGLGQQHQVQAVEQKNHQQQQLTQQQIIQEQQQIHQQHISQHQAQEQQVLQQQQAQVQGQQHYQQQYPDLKIGFGPHYPALMQIKSTVLLPLSKVQSNQQKHDEHQQQINNQHYQQLQLQQQHQTNQPHFANPGQAVSYQIVGPGVSFSSQVSQGHGAAHNQNEYQHTNHQSIVHENNQQTTGINKLVASTQNLVSNEDVIDINRAVEHENSNKKSLFQPGSTSYSDVASYGQKIAQFEAEHIESQNHIEQHIRNTSHLGGPIVVSDEPKNAIVSSTVRPIEEIQIVPREYFHHDNHYNDHQQHQINVQIEGDHNKGQYHKEITYETVRDDQHLTDSVQTYSQEAPSRQFLRKFKGKNLLTPSPSTEHEKFSYSTTASTLLTTTKAYSKYATPSPIPKDFLAPLQAAVTISNDANSQEDCFHKKDSSHQNHVTKNKNAKTVVEVQKSVNIKNLLINEEGHYHHQSLNTNFQQEPHFAPKQNIPKLNTRVEYNTHQQNQENHQHQFSQQQQQQYSQQQQQQFSQQQQQQFSQQHQHQHHQHIIHGQSSIQQQQQQQRNHQPEQYHQQQHFYIQQQPQIIEKHVQVPVHVEHIVEKPVPYPVEVEKIVNRPYPVQQIVEKQVPVHIHVEKKVPVPYPVEKIVEKPIHHTQYIDRPYPVEKIVEKKIRVPYPVEKVVEKFIDRPIHIQTQVPVEVPVEKIVEKKVPVEKIVEKFIDRPVPYPVEVKKYVDRPYPVEKIVEKIVDRPVEVEKIVEKEVKVPYPVQQIVEKIVDRPYEVQKIIEKPYPVPYRVEVEKFVDRPYPVEKIVEKPVHIKVPFEKIVEKFIDRPYAVEKIVEKEVRVEVPVEKIVDRLYPVEKFIDRPYPVEKIVEKIIDRPVHVQVPVQVPVHIPVQVPVQIPVHVPYLVEQKVHVPYPVAYPVHFPYKAHKHPEPIYYKKTVTTGGFNFNLFGGHDNAQKTTKHVILNKPNYHESSYSGAAYGNQHTFNHEDEYTKHLHINGKIADSHHHNFGIGLTKSTVLSPLHTSVNKHVHTEQPKSVYGPPGYISGTPIKTTHLHVNLDQDNLNPFNYAGNFGYQSYSHDQKPSSSWNHGSGNIYKDEYIGPVPLFNDYWGFRPSFKYRRHTENLNNVRIEYGFKPPMVPSIEINEHGDAINKEHEIH